MQVEVRIQLLVPRMQYEGRTWHSSTSVAELNQDRGDGLEEESQKPALVSEKQWIEEVGQGEDEMVVGDWQ